MFDDQKERLYEHNTYLTFKPRTVIRFDPKDKVRYYQNSPDDKRWDLG